MRFTFTGTYGGQILFLSAPANCYKCSGFKQLTKRAAPVIVLAPMARPRSNTNLYVTNRNERSVLHSPT